MALVPAELYSDEDDDDYGFGDFEDEDDPSWKHSTQNITRHIDEKERKLDKLFSDVINGHIAEIQNELEDGLDPNTILKENWSLLLLAASVGNPEVTKLLIERGADVNYDKDKFTVLMAACNCPSSCSPPEKALDVVKQLIEKGANVNALTRRRMTALMYACSSGNFEVVKFLLPLSNKFATDNQGWNALFWAVNDNRPEVVNLLLEEGFKETQLDVRNNTVLSYAVANGYQRIVELFPSQQDNLEQIYNYSSLNDFESVFKNLQKGERPQYSTELYHILCGSKSEHKMLYFIDNNVGLNTFLSITDKQLQTIGRMLPFQRYKILNSLYRFHKHPFLPASIPSVQKNVLYSTIETAKSLAAAVRQLVCMEATINYLIENSHMFSNKIDKKVFENSVKNVCDRLVRLKGTSKALHRRARYWDYLNSPADLINKDSCKRKRYLKMKLIGLALLPGVFLAWKVVSAKS